jgi:type III secretory pathway component EscU
MAIASIKEQFPFATAFFKALFVLLKVLFWAVIVVCAAAIVLGVVGGIAYGVLGLPLVVL